MIVACTDVVGSLLRPPELLAARQRWQRGEIGPVEFKRVEDAAVDAAIRLQDNAGLAVVTDGEMRRLSFQSQFPEAVAGFSDWDLDAFVWGDCTVPRSGTATSNSTTPGATSRLRTHR